MPSVAEAVFSMETHANCLFNTNRSAPKTCNVSNIIQTNHPCVSVHVSKCVFVWVCAYVLVYLYVGDLEHQDPGPWDKNKNITLVWFFFISFYNYFYICALREGPENFPFYQKSNCFCFLQNKEF